MSSYSFCATLFEPNRVIVAGAILPRRRVCHGRRQACCHAPLDHPTPPVYAHPRKDHLGHDLVVDELTDGEMLPVKVDGARSMAHTLCLTAGARCL